jgi:hypothetical protein
MSEFIFPVMALMNNTVSEYNDIISQGRHMDEIFDWDFDRKTKPKDRPYTLDYNEEYCTLKAHIHEWLVENNIIYDFQLSLKIYDVCDIMVLNKNFLLDPLKDNLVFKTNDELLLFGLCWRGRLIW